MNAWKFWMKRTLTANPQHPLPKVAKGIAPAWQSYIMDDRIVYSGQYTIFGRDGQIIFTLPGRIVVWRTFPTDVYIYRPPDELRALPKGACLQLINPDGDWFKLHWQTPAHTFEDSLAYVEDMLNQIPRRRLHQLASQQG